MKTNFFVIFHFRELLLGYFLADCINVFIHEVSVREQRVKNTKFKPVNFLIAFHS